MHQPCAFLWMRHAGCRETDLSTHSPVLGLRDISCWGTVLEDAWQEEVTLVGCSKGLSHHCLHLCCFSSVAAVNEEGDRDSMGDFPITFSPSKLLVYVVRSNYPNTSILLVLVYYHQIYRDTMKGYCVWAIQLNQIIWTWVQSSHKQAQQVVQRNINICRK